MKVLALVIFSVLAASTQAMAGIQQDGCYQMFQKTAGGLEDYGAMCLMGLSNESVGENLQIVTVDSEGQKNFCGTSTDFSNTANGAANDLKINLASGMGTIEFNGDDATGTITIGHTSVSYNYLAGQASDAFFAQCK